MKTLILISSGKRTVHLLDLRTFTKEKLIIPSADEDMEQQEFSFIAGRNVKWQSLWKTVWQSLTRLNIQWSYDPEMKVYVHTKTCMWIFTASLFIRIEIWKQLKYSSVGEWIHGADLLTGWNVNYSNKEQTRIHASTQMNLECIMKDARLKKSTCFIVPLLCRSEKSNHGNRK